MRIAVLFILILTLISCAGSLPVYYTRIAGNAIQVPVSGFENSNINIVSDDTVPFSILLIKRSQQAYDGYHLKCSHDQKALDVTPENVVCPVCLSTYDLDGVVRTGPATTGLLKFATELNPDQTLVRINIEALGL